ncbi:hypothetical protein CAOG_06351 [Capsaspora owczarzaki ATCC 30864]|nr:hypothetical protein CAOG_06351 [Capsaspora owczarzaki ATCC 30864]|eukprot:XP_004345100.1 hypothetical protein CAOG_06351 [Capsaspora owczarzaki ATCC 30864]
MSAALPRLVPWATRREWEAVRQWLFASGTSERDQTRATARIMAWKSRGKVPTAVDVTATLVECQLKDAHAAATPAARNTRVVDAANSAAEASILRYAYANSIVRFVNGIVDAEQKGVHARSVNAIAVELGVPEWIVDIRHDVTHTALPTLALLRTATSRALEWLREHYWDAQQDLLDEDIRSVKAMLADYHNAVVRKLQAQEGAVATEADFLEASLAPIVQRVQPTALTDVLIPCLFSKDGIYSYTPITTSAAPATPADSTKSTNNTLKGKKARESAAAPAAASASASAQAARSAAHNSPALAAMAMASQVAPHWIDAVAFFLRQWPQLTSLILQLGVADVCSSLSSGDETADPSSRFDVMEESDDNEAAAESTTSPFADHARHSGLRMSHTAAERTLLVDLLSLILGSAIRSAPLVRAALPTTALRSTLDRASLSSTTPSASSNNAAPSSTTAASFSVVDLPIDLLLHVCFKAMSSGAIQLLPLLACAKQRLLVQELDEELLACASSTIGSSSGVSRRPKQKQALRKSTEGIVARYEARWSSFYRRLTALMQLQQQADALLAAEQPVLSAFHNFNSKATSVVSSAPARPQFSSDQRDTQLKELDRLNQDAGQRLVPGAARADGERSVPTEAAALALVSNPWKKVTAAHQILAWQFCPIGALPTSACPDLSLPLALDTIAAVSAPREQDSGFSNSAAAAEDCQVVGHQPLLQRGLKREFASAEDDSTPCEETSASEAEPLEAASKRARLVEPVSFDPFLVPGAASFEVDLL